MPIKPSDAGLRSLYPQLTADQKLTKAEVEQLITSAKDGTGLSKTEKADLEKMLARDANLFEADAKAHLEAYLGRTPQPPAPPVQPTTPGTPPVTPSPGTTPTGVWFPIGTRPVTPPPVDARARLDAVVARLSPEVKALVEPLVARNGKVSAGDVLDLQERLVPKGMAQSPERTQKANDLYALATLASPVGGELLQEAWGTHERRFGNRGDLWLYNQKDLGLDKAQALVEARLKNFPSFQVDSRNTALTEVMIAREDSFTFEARQRIALGAMFDKSKVAVLALALEKDGLDAGDVKHLADRLATLQPWEQVTEKETLKRALAFGFKVQPEAEAAFSALTGAVAPNLQATPGAGPFHAPGTVPSRHALGNARYGDTPIGVLEGRQVLTETELGIARRFGELVRPAVTDGVLKVSTLLQVEKSPLWETLSPGEKLALPRLFKALEAQSTSRTEALKAFTPSPLASLAQVRVTRPAPLDLGQSVPVTDALAPPVADRAVADRVQRVANADGQAGTISLKDLDAVLAGAPGFTADDLERAKAIRGRLDEQLRLKPVLAPAELSFHGLRQEQKTVLNEALGITVTTKLDFDSKLQLTRTNAVSMRLPDGATLRDEQGRVVKSTAAGFFQSTPTDISDLPPGRYLLESPRNTSGAVEFELPAWPPAKESVDLSAYSAYVMGTFAQPSTRYQNELEEYFRTYRDPATGQNVTRVDSVYWAPGAVKTYLPPGEYALPGTDLKVLLNSRVNATDYWNKQAGGKLTQVLVVDGAGQVQSVTGGSAKLPDGRAVSVSASNGQLTVRVGSEQYKLELANRVG